MADVKTLSAKQLTDAAKHSAAKVLEARAGLKAPPGTTVGFVPPYHWIGLILREEAKLEKIADAKKIAADIHAGISASIPSLKGGTPGAIIHGGHIIMGFVPPREIDVISE
jgi:hypothetical protein